MRPVLDGSRVWAEAWTSAPSIPELPYLAQAHPFEFLEVVIMLYWSIVFFIIALIAGVLGFGGIAGSMVGIAKILFFVFLVVFVVSLVLGRRPAV